MGHGASVRPQPRLPEQGRPVVACARWVLAERGLHVWQRAVLHAALLGEPDIGGFGRYVYAATRPGDRTAAQRTGHGQAIFQYRGVYSAGRRAVWDRFAGIDRRAGDRVDERLSVAHRAVGRHAIV